jgi:hypothetical protein
MANHELPPLTSSSQLTDCYRWSSLYSLNAGCIQNTASSIVMSVSVAAETSLPCLCLAMAASACSTILALSHHVTLRFTHTVT